MRISEKAKKENRRKIMTTAAKLFAEQGFEETTTRDIARQAGLAAGTMFNYFKSKETLAMTMVAEALEQGIEEYHATQRGDEELNEDLFQFIICGLNRLRPMHPFVGPVLEKSLSPFPKKNSCHEGEAARARHLATVREILERHGHGLAPELILVHVYWSLFLGILAFWCKDDSPVQEASLAVIDYSLSLFGKMIVGSDPSGEF